MGKSLLLLNLFFLFFLSLNSPAQTRISLNQYIQVYKNVAIEEMQVYGIPASIKMAQGILESGFGNSDLATEANNHFGIKCHGWQGHTFYKDDDEKDECFRAYEDPKQSWRDHSEFLKSRARYEFLFSLRQSDYKGWARGLQRAGYATNPNYSRLLIRIIEENELYKLDKQVLADTKTPRGRERDRETKPDRRSPVEVADPDDFAPVTITREVLINNRIRYIKARPGDTPKSIAKDFEMREWQIIRYNDFDKNVRLNSGQIVYLQPKRRRGETRTHILKSGETLHDISQQYGVRLKHLYSRNNIKPGDEPNPGDTLKLRR